MPLISKAIQGLAGGIGLAAEAKSRQKPIDSDHNNNKVEFDEQEWMLDDAQDGTSTLQAQSPLETDPTKAVEAFLQRHPAPSVQSQRLDLPVLLPQRHPAKRSRGFVRAYAPELGKAQISQDVFIDFLETFNAASQSSTWINALNLAVIPTYFLPPGISEAVRLAIEITVETTKDLQQRKKTNTFLDNLNDGFMHPRGVHCMIVTYRPHAPQTLRTEVNITTAFSDAATTAQLHPTKHSLEASAATAKPDFPDVAPLIYPGLDQAAPSMNDMSSTKDFIKDYYDRRAQAKFAAENPNSQLTSSSEKQSFASRYADPDHPANNGSLISFVSGGHIVNQRKMDRVEQREERRGEKQERRQAKTQERAERRGRETYLQQLLGVVGMSKKDGGLVRRTKRVLNPDVLYMLIVNIPTEEEMHAVQEYLNDDQQQA